MNNVYIFGLVFMTIILAIFIFFEERIIKIGKKLLIELGKTFSRKTTIVGIIEKTWQKPTFTKFPGFLLRNFISIRSEGNNGRCITLEISSSCLQQLKQRFFGTVSIKYEEIPFAKYPSVSDVLP